MIKNSLFGHATIYILSNFLVVGVSFLLLPILTRELDPEAYGVIAMFSMVVSLLSVFIGLNIYGSIGIRYFEKPKIDIPKYISTSLVIMIIATVIMAIFILPAGEMLTELTSIPLNWLYAALSVAFLQLILQVLLTLWQASKKPLRYGVIRTSQSLLDITISITLVVGLTMSWQGRIGGILVASICVAIVAIYYLIREDWLAKSIDLTYAKDALKYGVPLIPHAVGGVILGMTDRFMVNNILNVSSTGIYVVAVQIGFILGILADSFNRAFAPWLMEKLSNKNYFLQKKIVIFTYIYFVVIIALAIITSKLFYYILPFVVGPQFQAAGPLLIYIMLGNAFIGMYYMVTNYIFYSGRTGLLSTLTICVGGMTIAMNWFLINEYGLKGAAIGFMLGQASLFVGAWIISNHCIPMPWFKIFMLKRSIH